MFEITGDEGAPWGSPFGVATSLEIQNATSGVRPNLLEIRSPYTRFDEIEGKKS